MNSDNQEINKTKEENNKTQKIKDDSQIKENEITNIAKAIPKCDSSTPTSKNDESKDKVNRLDFDKKYSKENGTLSKIRGLNFEDSSPIAKIEEKEEPTPSGLGEYKLTIMKLLDDSGRNYQLKSQYNNNNSKNDTPMNKNKNNYNFSFYVQNNSLLKYYDNSFLGSDTPVNNENEKLTKPNDFLLNNNNSQTQPSSLLFNFHNSQISKNNSPTIRNNHNNNLIPFNNSPSFNNNVSNDSPIHLHNNNNNLTEHIINLHNNEKDILTNTLNNSNNNNDNSNISKKSINSLNHNINNNNLNIDNNNNNFNNFYSQKKNINQNLNSNAYNYYVHNYNPKKQEQENLNIQDNYYDNVNPIPQDNNYIYNQNIPQFIIPPNPIVNLNVNTNIPNQTINYYPPSMNTNQNILNMMMINQMQQQNNPQIVFSFNENENNNNIQQKKKKKLNTNIKSNFSSMSLNELIKNCVSLSKEQNSCRWIQKKIEEQPEIVPKILNNLFQNILEIINDSFGNYLIQKLFDYMNKEQFLQFMALIQIDFYQICINSYGTRVIQKLIDYLNLEILLKTFMNIIKPTVKGIIIDINGSHIILKLMNLKNKYINSVILNEVCDNILNISKHKHGCCVLQKCIEKIDVNERKPLIDNLLNYCKELISDKCGNYIIQFIISFNDEKIMEVINNILITDIENFSKQKFSSNVVEKILEKAPNKICKDLITSLNNEKIILSILFDKFGNYVLQKSLQRADKNTQKFMLQVIAPHLYKLKYYSFGLKLYSRLIITYSYLGQIILDKGNSGNNNNNVQNSFNMQDNIIDMNLIQNSNNDLYNVPNNNFIYNNNYYNNNTFQNIGINNNMSNDFILNNMYNQNK